MTDILIGLVLSIIMGILWTLTDTRIEEGLIIGMIIFFLYGSLVLKKDNYD